MIWQSKAPRAWPWARPSEGRLRLCCTAAGGAQADHVGRVLVYDVPVHARPAYALVSPTVGVDRLLSKSGEPRPSDGLTKQHAGCEARQCCRKRIEETLGWINASADLAKVKVRGRPKGETVFHLLRL
jgi:hypothetical protein